MLSHGEARLRIDASPNLLWALVADIPNIGLLSPECVHCRWIGSVQAPVPGARFIGINRRGPVVWATISRVAEAVPGEVFSFDTRATATRWTYRFRADGAATLVTESREDLGPRPLAARVFSTLLLGSDHDTELIDGMEQTLRRLADVAGGTIEAG